jgi:lipopolysaccharide biosynthesis glycosyltransferase
MNKNNEYLPICYRCDNKYKYFLLNSIKSLLKYYKGDLIPYFYICTTEKDFEIKEILNLQKTYNFKIEIINFNEAFLEKHSLTIYSKHIHKKYMKFWDQSHWLKSTKYNNTTFQYNPFNRSKMICCCWVFFFAITKHEKMLILDTDTIIVDNVFDIFKIDITDSCMAICQDWVIPDTVSPSVAVQNCKKFRDKVILSKDGLISTIINFSNKPNDYEIPFADLIQCEMNRLLEKNYVLLDKSWNVPLTHIYEYGVTPKIYHFSESWNGITSVLDKYEEIVDKYVKDE